MLYRSDNNSITNNNVSMHVDHAGIYVDDYSDNNTVHNNTVNNNRYGIRLDSNSKNMLTYNTVNTNEYGIRLDSSNDNLIYNNYFNNTNNAYDNGNNIWNITKTAGINIIGGQHLGGNYWSDYAGHDLDGDGLGDILIPHNSSGDIAIGGDYLPLVKPVPSSVFDTDSGTYPSMMGTHSGTITPSRDVTVTKMYTYACAGTGGHSEYVRIYGMGINESGTWNGYQSEDYQCITFDNLFTLKANVIYSYTIKTGSYPQIIHEQNHTALEGGTITCTEFRDANGRNYHDWIPAIRLWS